MTTKFVVYSPEKGAYVCSLEHPTYFDSRRRFAGEFDSEASARAIASLLPSDKAVVLPAEEAEEKVGH